MSTSAVARTICWGSPGARRHSRRVSKLLVGSQMNPDASRSLGELTLDPHSLLHQRQQRPRRTQEALLCLRRCPLSFVLCRSYAAPRGAAYEGQIVNSLARAGAALPPRLIGIKQIEDCCLCVIEAAGHLGISKPIAPWGGRGDGSGPLSMAPVLDISLPARLETVRLLAIASRGVRTNNQIQWV